MRRLLAAFAVLVLTQMAFADGDVGFKAYPPAPQYARLAFGSVTGTNLATCNTLITLTSDHYMTLLINSLNADISIAYNGVETFRLESGESFSMDLKNHNLKLGSTKTLCIWANGAAPTSGSMRVTLF